MATTLKPAARDIAGGVYLTASDFDALMVELESLRRAVAGADASTHGASIPGIACVGSIVRVRDRTGRTSEYELIGDPDPADGREKVALDSPLGQALIGARRGEYINLVAGNGRRRRARVLDVQPSSGPAG